MTARVPRGQARRRLLDQALRLFREKGYGATSVDDLCAAAGVTKGAFFHSFPNKQALGCAAMQHWAEVTDGLFDHADYHAHPDPLDRVLAYLDLRRDLVRGKAAEYTCVAGTVVQEIHATHPAIRQAAGQTIRGGAGHVEADLALALTRHPVPGISAESLSLHVQAVIQGALVMAKSQDDPALAVQSVDHLARYIRLLFGRAE
ncbi:MAG: TetR/AcrR family transcriptional regulator [Gemmobacter sp.]